MAFVHRKLWSFKPKEYGPWKIVHRSLLLNAEQMGIDPATISLALPMWNPGDQRDYSKNSIDVTNDSAVYAENELNFSGGSNLSFDAITFTEFSFVTTCKQTLSGNNGMICGDATSTNNFVFMHGGVDLWLRWSGSGILFPETTDFTSLETYAYRGSSTDSKHVLFKSGKYLAEKIVGVTSITINSFGVGYNPITTFALNGTIAGATLFDVALKSDVLCNLSDNPYQLWKPVPQKTIFLPFDAGGSATLTGTAITGGVTESEIVTGGKTIIITLTGDTWVATVGADNAITDALILGITSAQSEATGWNAVVRANMVFGDVARTSDTIVTITLAAEATYSITANETITITIPATALTAAGAVVATPTFDVTNEGVGFNAAWAGGANTLMQPGVAA